MKYSSFLFLLSILVSCKELPGKKWSAQQIIDKTIEVAGGELYTKSSIAFTFRDQDYISEDQGSILKRIYKSDSLQYIDVKKNKSLERFVEGLKIQLSDSLATVYGNSVNSVHYFAQLPYRLNDPAVHKQLLDEMTADGKAYYVIQVNFDEVNGGNDYQDTYVYWIDKHTFKVDYLAYDFLTDGGGVRFREAYNERYVSGIRFVDYKNYKPMTDDVTVFETMSLFLNNKLAFLSDIQLTNINVRME